MQRKIRLLLVEDREHDAALIISQLRREGFEPAWHRVDCEAEYLLHLDSGLDAILSDSTLPSFDVTTALRLLRERQLDVPFIVISGTIGEERAVEVLKQGAADYLLKDRLQRLGDAITRAMETRVLQRDFRCAQDAVSALLHRLIGEDIRLTLELDSSLGCTKADPGQIEQVIVNLAINARDAMASGGTLTVQTTNLDVDDEFFQRHGFANESDTNRFVVLSITDTGCGMEPAVQQRIFEPFFTMKPKGKGTGLGLATVYGIVKQSGGSIWAYSEPGHGTTFKIYLPRTDQTVQTDLATMPVQAPLHGTETILLVEDEDAVRMLSLALLERQGYHVLVAADAEQALRIAESGPTPLDLLVTDVVMPGQSGPELFARLRPHRPGMRVLFLSGYTDEAIVKRGVLRARTPFLQKPFTATALSTKVRELLDGDAPHL